MSRWILVASITIITLCLLGVTAVVAQQNQKAPVKHL